MQKQNFNGNESILSFRKLFHNIKKLFILWLSAAILVFLIISVYSTTKEIIGREINVIINFSFDGIESGHDPSGNKFDANEIKDKTAIKTCLDDMGKEYSDNDVENIYTSISISGNVPSDVINRITNYSSIYSQEDVNQAPSVGDKTYYPTQYTITMDCSRVNLSFSQSAKFLNKLTENYTKTFFSKYGYKKSLEDAITVIDYNDYDYIDAISVFDSSLTSIQNYIDNIANNDETRFRSEKSGYTFTDLSRAINTIRTEDLDLISSYVTVYNVTKSKENLIANYQFKIEDLTRNKTICEEQIKTLNDTISAYEKNSILIFANATSGTDATLNSSTETYDNLIEQQVNLQKQLSSYEQRINMLSKRIDGLKNNTNTGSSEKVSEDLDKINNKITDLLNTVNITVSEYYENEVLKNSYTIISEASDSIFSIIKTSISKYWILIIASELIIISLYLLTCTVAVNQKVYDSIVLVKNKIFRKKAKDNKSKSDKKKNK